MREANAQIIIDVVMGELQKKEQFSGRLATLAENSINRGFEKAAKARKSALNQAIVNGIYKESPASKVAIKKLAKSSFKTFASVALGEQKVLDRIIDKQAARIQKRIDKYNKKYSRKGGFWNFLGSFAVNTGILSFGQGYKGGNFVRDRYQDHYKFMDDQGQIRKRSAYNFGRIGADIISAGQFLSNAIMTVADLIGQGAERIKKSVDSGMSNTQEIVAIANSLGLKRGEDLRPVAAAINAIDSLMAGTSYQNLTNTLFQYFRGDEAKQLARQAGFTGKTELDLAMEYIQSVLSNEIFGKDGRLISMTEEQRAARDKMAPVFGTKELRRLIQQQASAYGAPLFGINEGKYGGKYGGEYLGLETLYMKALSKLGPNPLTQEEFINYQRQSIELKLMELSEYSKSFLSVSEETRALYESYFATQQQTIERELKFFQEHGQKVLEANRRMEHFLGKIVDNTTVIAANLVNPSSPMDTVRSGLKVARAGVAGIASALAAGKAAAIASGKIGTLVGSAIFPGVGSAVVGTVSALIGGVGTTLYVLSQDD